MLCVLSWQMQDTLQQRKYTSNAGLLVCLQVQYREEYKSFTHFITSVCAIVGGVFTVSGLIDSFIYHGQKVCSCIVWCSAPTLDRSILRMIASCLLHASHSRRIYLALLFLSQLFVCMQPEFLSIHELNARDFSGTCLNCTFYGMQAIKKKVDLGKQI